jgi:hypothetical protein
MTPENKTNKAKEMILNNIIGINPTGQLTYEGSFHLNGNVDIIKTTTTSQKDALSKATDNKIICNHIETFENNNHYELENINILFHPNCIKENYVFFLIISIIILFYLFFLYFI